MAFRREVPKFNNDGSRSKKDSVQYLCAVCGTWVKSTAAAVDHIHPVVCVDEGFIDYNTFVQRLFCPKENLQVICSTCHEAKTLRERIERLIKKYTKELDELELEFAVSKGGLSVEDKKVILKALTKLIATKRTPELREISGRATALKEKIKASLKSK